MPDKTFCELMKEQLIDEDKAGELYETAKKLLHHDHLYDNPAVNLLKNRPVDTEFAILEKIATDERSHKVLLQVLYGRLCP